MNKTEQLLGIIGLGTTAASAVTIILTVVVTQILTAYGRMTSFLNVSASWLCFIAALTLIGGGIVSGIAHRTLPGRIGLGIVLGMIALTLLILYIIYRAYANLAPRN